MKIFLIGSTTDEAADHSREFGAVEHAIAWILRASNSGFPSDEPLEVVNPVRLDDTLPLPTAARRRRNIGLISEADAVFMVRDWMSDEGARIENQAAINLGLIRWGSLDEVLGWSLVYAPSGS